MKLVSFETVGAVRPGILTDSGIIDIIGAWPGDNPPRSVKEILEKGDACLEQVRELAQSATKFIPQGRVKLCAPIPRPGKVLGLAGNYAKHIKEAGLKLGLSESPRKNTVPRPFLMPATCVIGPGDEIPWPCYSEQIDYEVELAVVIGRTAKCVKPEPALDYVAGYTIANDISARSVTFARGRKPRPWDEFYDWLNGKWADGFLPTGPALVTPDEVGDPQRLGIELRVNGRVRQKANTSEMIFGVAEVVSFCSHLMTLEPGDLIATGTPAGVAMATGDFLKPGDKIECRIEPLGVLNNTLGKQPSDLYTPLADG